MTQGPRINWVGRTVQPTKRPLPVRPISEAGRRPRGERCGHGLLFCRRCSLPALASGTKIPSRSSRGRGAPSRRRRRRARPARSRESIRRRKNLAVRPTSGSRKFPPRNLIPPASPTHHSHHRDSNSSTLFGSRFISHAIFSVPSASTGGVRVEHTQYSDVTVAESFGCRVNSGWP